MSITRKVLRFGRIIPVLNNIRNRFAENDKKPVNMLFTRTMADLCLAIYYLLDHPQYFSTIGFVKFSKETANKLDFMCEFHWFIGIIFEVITDLGELRRIDRETANAARQLKTVSTENQTEVSNAKKKIEELKKQKRAVYINLARSIIDFPIALRLIGYLDLSAKNAGLCGAITSAIGIYQMCQTF